MNDRHWTISELPWDQFDADKLDPDLLQVVKAAALVEYGGDRYARYLCNVFADDPVFQQAARDWAAEETQHGEALGRYAERADASFNFRLAFDRFSAGYNFPVDTHESVRGSRSGELIARCIVETGTSSYYTAIADTTQEPLIKALCRRIAADELRHYKFFYTYLRQYLDRETLGRLSRLRIGIGRMRESEDDELAYAYYAANAPADVAYRRETYAGAYMTRAYRFYKPEHIRRVVAMVFKACGLRPHTVLHGLVNRAAWWLLNKKIQNAMKAAV